MYDLSWELAMIMTTILWLQVRENLSASKQASRKHDMEGFNLMKLGWMFRNSTRLKSQTGLLLWRT
jgi:hypothetical protein